MELKNFAPSGVLFCPITVLPWLDKKECFDLSSAVTYAVCLGFSKEPEGCRCSDLAGFARCDTHPLL